MGQGSISPFLDLFVVCVCVAVFNFNLPPRAFQVDVSRRCLWKNSFIPLPCMSMHFFPPHGQRGEGVKAFKPSSASLVFIFFNNNRKFLSTLRGTSYLLCVRVAHCYNNNQQPNSFPNKKSFVLWNFSLGTLGSLYRIFPFSVAANNNRYSCVSRVRRLVQSPSFVTLPASFFRHDGLGYRPTDVCQEANDCSFIDLTVFRLSYYQQILLCLAL